MLIILAIPLLGILLHFINKSKEMHGFIEISVNTALLIMTALLASEVIKNGSISAHFFTEFRLDGLSMLILFISASISFLVSIYTTGYMDCLVKKGRIEEDDIRRYYILIDIFVFAAIVAITAGNMGIMWIGIEGTTLATVFLVGFFNDKFSIEASWKYLIICSVGIALALLGITLLHISSVQLVASTGQELSWKFFMDNASRLAADPLRLSFIFILVGFGTKAGLVPMHTWLPDAYSSAPSPISALSSAVLLNTAMYGILRALSIVNKALSNNFANYLLIGIGLLTVFAAAIFILTQKEYKRMLAYSSIEHMGLIAFGIGLNSKLAISAALLHMVNHSFTKAALFLSAGSIHQRTDVTEMNKITGLIKIMPISALGLFIGAFAVLGTPPFSIFTSELGIITASTEKMPIIVPICILAMLILVFIGFFSNLVPMMFGKPSINNIPVQMQKESRLLSAENNKLGALIIIIILMIIATTGLYIPKFLWDMIELAQQVILG